MKKAAILIPGLILIAASLSVVLIATFFKGEDKIVFNSPLTGRGQVLGVNLWFPSINTSPDANSPKITAKSALFIDTKSGKILYAKNEAEKLPIASLTKVMTALIALENKNLNDEFLVSEPAANMEPDKMLLIAGEKLTLKELLYGIFLISANDAAEVIAEGSLPAGRQEFINLMNAKAKQLGMRDSLFVNPTGLDEDFSNSYSSAYDMALLTRYLIRRFPQVVEISKMPHIYLPLTQNHQDYDMYSGINLLTTYPGVVGFKTGYTPVAGLTIITLARKGDHEVIGVLLGSQNRREEVRELLDYSFSQL